MASETHRTDRSQYSQAALAGRLCETVATSVDVAARGNTGDREETR